MLQKGLKARFRNLKMTFCWKFKWKSNCDDFWIFRSCPKFAFLSFFDFAQNFLFLFHFPGFCFKSVPFVFHFDHFHTSWCMYQTFPKFVVLLANSGRYCLAQKTSLDQNLQKSNVLQNSQRRQEFQTSPGLKWRRMKNEKTAKMKRQNKSSEAL